MRVYRVLSRPFPRSFAAKIFVITFLGTHVPLIAFVVAVLFGAGPVQGFDAVILLTLATLAGTGATLLALRAVLHPLSVVARHLAAWDDGRHPGALPEGFEDEVGQVMRHANQLMDRATWWLHQSRTDAETDLVTGILNRRGADRWLARNLTPGWILQFAIDRFEAINDRWGRECGEVVLREVARAAGYALRPGDMIARLDDDEFVVVLPLAGGGQAREIAERLRLAVEKRVRIGGETVSVLGSLVPHLGGGDVAVPLRKGNAALHRAKLFGSPLVVEAAAS